jgi:hypothetical protein
VAIVINKADATLNVSGVTVTYDGDAHGATGTAIGVKGETLAGLDLGASFTDVPGGTANWTFTDVTGNYNDDSGSVAIVINKADATLNVSGVTVTYDGDAHGATGTAIGVKGETLAGLDLGASFTNVPGGTANWTFTDVTGNYNDDSGSVAIVINKADATLNVSGVTVTYDGDAHGATGTAVGVKGETLAGLDLGASFTNVPGGTANWTFTDATGNYNDASGSVEIVINKAEATLNVSGVTVTYDGDAHGATGRPSASRARALAGLDLGASFTNVPGGTANWTFTDVTGNYNDDSGSVEIVINKADATLNVSGVTVTYDGDAHGATGTAIGVKGETLAGLDLGASFTDVPGGTANWTFTDVTGNYTDDSGSVAIVINKADATLNVSGVTVTYDGDAHGATGHGHRRQGRDAGRPGPGRQLHQRARRHGELDVHGRDGQLHRRQRLGGHRDQQGRRHAQRQRRDGDLRRRRPRGHGHGHRRQGRDAGRPGPGRQLHERARGHGQLDVHRRDRQLQRRQRLGGHRDQQGRRHAQRQRRDGHLRRRRPRGHGHGHRREGRERWPAWTWAPASPNVPGGTANWTFTDVTGNYNDDSGSVAIVINKADATLNVSGVTVTYDGDAHGATGTAIGVKGETLAGLDLGASFTNVPGGTANWVFTDVTGNYNDDSGSVAIVINKADATLNVSGVTVTYDGDAHGATGRPSASRARALAGLDLGASFTNVPGGTANWTFTDVTGNYNDASGSVAIVINKADATLNVSGVTVTYDGDAHGATGTAIGVKGETLAGLDLGASFTNVPGGTANWTFTDVTGNYNDDSGSVAIVINKADATLNVSGVTVTYDGDAHGATGTAIGVKGETLAGLDLGASFTNVPGGTANWTFTDVTGNYNDDSGSVEIVITAAPLTITAVHNTKVYDGNVSAAAIPTVSGLAAGDTVTGLAQVYTDPDTWSRRCQTLPG